MRIPGFSRRSPPLPAHPLPLSLRKHLPPPPLPRRSLPPNFDAPAVVAAASFPKLSPTIELSRPSLQNNRLPDWHEEWLDAQRFKSFVAAVAKW
ncbi:hypothetical protein Drorol1_Dr00016341 [Drosera rotundifolia]